MYVDPGVVVESQLVADGLTVCSFLLVIDRGVYMSSEIIVVLVIVGLSIIGLVYLEMHSRRNKKKAEEGRPELPTAGNN